MTEVILISIVAIALALIAIYLFYTRKKGKRIVINKTMFVAGLIMALLAALMMFCQERCFLGVDLESWPAVLGIIGIVFIATSQFTPMKQKKKR